MKLGLMNERGKCEKHFPLSTESFLVGRVNLPTDLLKAGCLTPGEELLVARLDCTSPVARPDCTSSVARWDWRALVAHLDCMFQEDCWDYRFPVAH